MQSLILKSLVVAFLVTELNGDLQATPPSEPKNGSVTLDAKPESIAIDPAIPEHQQLGSARTRSIAIYDDMIFRDPGNSEDCLTLNVWTPTTDKKAKLRDLGIPSPRWTGRMVWARSQLPLNTMASLPANSDGRSSGVNCAKSQRPWRSGWPSGARGIAGFFDCAATDRQVAAMNASVKNAGRERRRMDRSFRGRDCNAD